MAELKTKPTGAIVDDFLKGVAEEARRQDCLALLQIVRDATGAEPAMWGSSIVGFGAYHYKYPGGREGDWFLVGFAPRKRDITLYLMSGFDAREGLLAQLGKHSTGKGCLYIKRLVDVDLTILNELISASVKHLKQMYG